MNDEELKTKIHFYLRHSLASDEEEALRIILETKKLEDKSDLFTLFKNANVARDIFPNMVNETPYNHSDIRSAYVPSGILDKVTERDDVAFAALKEFAIKEKNIAKIVAEIKNIPFEGKDGIFLSSFVGAKERLVKEGKETYDMRNNLYRIEFSPVSGDFIKGMFLKWDEIFNDTLPLIAYIHRNRVYNMSMFREK